MDLKDSSDTALIEEFKKGAHEAFDELIERHSSRLYQAAYGLLSSKEDAEEVVQDAFIRAYNALGSFRGDASFETWIYRIVVNLARNKYHWNRRRGQELNMSLTRDNTSGDFGQGEEIELPDNSMEPDCILEVAETEGDIMECLEKLPETIRETLVMRHVNEFSYEKIAETLSCNIGTVKSRIARGREMLKNMIQKLNRKDIPAREA
ncbi:MAG: hypothetical protein A2020_11835 [Lentisphaerae bacterium GWF2_45_14]|nr:MAG: hypothetical protein A2020_11835 [Lentisphaerae bacterium GWF2_45_14]